MKIQQNGNYFTQYNDNHSKNSSTKSVFFGNQSSESNSQQRLGNSFFSPATRISVPPMVKFSEVKMANEKPLKNDDETIQNETLESLAREREIYDRKVEKINNLLKTLGISGDVTATRAETIPQSYSMYYVETEGKNKKNVVVIELENGEYMVSETSRDSDKLFKLLDFFRDNNGFNNRKFNVEELKDLFTKFLISAEERSEQSEIIRQKLLNTSVTVIA